jgi:hypothetical protein
MNQTNRQPLAVGVPSTYELATTRSYFSLSACSMYEADLWLSPTVEQCWAMAGLALALKRNPIA